jgi:hypothetical protein
MEDNLFEVIERLSGSEDAKRQFKVVLAHWQGKFTGAEACRLLDMDEEMFANLQRTALQGMADGLAKEKL